MSRKHCGANDRDKCFFSMFFAKKTRTLMPLSLRNNLSPGIVYSDPGKLLSSLFHWARRCRKDSLSEVQDIIRGSRYSLLFLNDLVLRWSKNKILIYFLRKSPTINFVICDHWIFRNFSSYSFVTLTNSVLMSIFRIWSILKGLQNFNIYIVMFEG